MKRLQLFIPLFLLSVLIFSTSSAQSGYIKIGDIKGESTDSKHKDWIDVLSFSQAMAKPEATATGQSRRRGSVVMEDIVITKRLDMSSPKIAEALVRGVVIPEATIELVNNSRVPYYTITLTNVMVSSLNTSGACSPQCGVDEQLSLNFEKITWTYIDSRGGKVSTTYNIETNR